MKNITLFSTLLLFVFSLNATAQASATEQQALDAISEVSDLVTTSRWEKGLVYKIQILASKDPLQDGDTRLKNLGNVYSYQHDGLTKYTWGRTRLPHEAARLQGEMHRNGFKDAFVVHYYNGKRITAEEARALRK